MGGFTVTRRGLSPDHSESVGVGQLPAAAVTAALTDALGRTKVQGPSGGGLRDVVSVMDAPFSAVGDGVADDTTPVQNAINAVSTAGGGTVLLPANRTFLLNSITPASNVTVSAYGATLKLKPVATHAMFYWNANTLSNFTIRGGTFPGTGAETTAQAVLQVNATPGPNPGICVDVNVYDTTVTNWATGPFYYGGCVRGRAINNTMSNIGAVGGTNAINFVGQSGASQNATECIAIGNIIEGAVTPGIAFGNTGITAATEIRILFANNVVICNGSGSGSAIDVECATVGIGENSELIIANNHAVYSGSSTSGAAITVIGSSGTDPLTLSRVVISGNTVTSTQNGMSIQCSMVAIAGNTIEAVRQGIFAGRATSFAVTGDISTGSNQILNASTNANILNGSPLSGTGIPLGTFLVSGAGTTTWTMSTNATATTTGLAITVSAQSRNMLISNNVIHAPASPTNSQVVVQQVRDSHITGNIIAVEAGSTTTNSALAVTLSGWIKIDGNSVNNAGGRGISYTSGNDVEITNNRVYNPSASAGGLNGVQVQNVSGQIIKIEGNTVIDDRAAHLMATGIECSSGTNSLPAVRNNRVSGATTLINGAVTKTGNLFTTGAASGRAVLVAGTVTVSTAEIQTSDNVLLSVVVAGGTRGEVQLGTITAGTSFVINSIQPGTASTLQASDTSTVFWKIEH